MCKEDFSDDARTSTYCGTIGYLAPEICEVRLYLKIFVLRDLWPQRLILNQYHIHLLKQLDTENLVSNTIKKHLAAKQSELQKLTKERENQKDKEGTELETLKASVIEKREQAVEDFENIAKELLQYLKNDTQTKSMITSMLQKLQRAETPIEWRNAAYCLTQLKYNETVFPKLLEGLSKLNRIENPIQDCYKERIAQSPEVKEYFMTILKQVKDLFKTKPEMKQHLEDFENKINIDENSQLQEEEALYLLGASLLKD